ncbi:MAG: hypothetical protein HC836_47360 [Richelia sp. RM2_1_2]|nr:hypothetical protein [Richelia sp. RM2_1_2]
MKNLLSIGIVSFSALVTFLPLWAQTTSSASNVVIAQQPPLSSEEEGLIETEKMPEMNEKNATYYQLIANGYRALKREEAVRAFTLAKSRVAKMEDIPESKKQELIQAAENGLQNVDKINFAENRGKLASYLEDNVIFFRSRGNEDEAKKLQERAKRVRSGELTNIYDAMR